MDECGQKMRENEFVRSQSLTKFQAANGKYRCGKMRRLFDVEWPGLPYQLMAQATFRHKIVIAHNYFTDSIFTMKGKLIHPSVK